MASQSSKSTLAAKNKFRSSTNQLDCMHWNLIKQYFQGQWVELTEVEWDWDAQSQLRGPSAWHPKKARVRNFAAQRHELLRILERTGRASDSTIVYVSSARHHNRIVLDQVASPANAA